MTDWHVIVIEGHERDVRDFVSGFLAGRKADPSSVVFGDDVGLERESLHERLRALLKGGHHAVFAPPDLVAAVEDAIAQRGDGPTLRVADRHPVTGASFGFHAEVASREVSSRIRAAVAQLPAGANFEQHSEHEEEHASAKGVELYAPVHHYEYRVRATLAGPFGGVLEVRRRLGEIEAVELEPLRLR